MKEGADERLHSGFAIDGDQRATQREVDLSALANQLNAIAAELRGDDAAGLHLFSPASKNAKNHLHCVHDWSDAQDDLERRRSVYVQYARAAYATRRRRSTIFGDSELFGEPAWDILLDLYIAHVEDTPVSVSSCCRTTQADFASSIGVGLSITWDAKPKRDVASVTTATCSICS